MARVIVLGAGLGGLAAAHALLAAGHDVQVFDAAARPGGVIHSDEREGYVREHAASSFLGGPDDGALALCEALNVPVEKAAPEAKRRWIYIDGALHALPASPWALARTTLLSWRGKLELLREPLVPARALGKPGEESVYEFFARRIGAEAARAFVAPFVTGIYADDAAQVSLATGFPKLAALEARGGLLRGGLRMAWAGRHGPRTARGLWAPRGGVGKLIEALAKQLEGRVQLGRRAVALARQGGDVSVRFSDGLQVMGGCVVAAMPAGALAELEVTVAEAGAPVRVEAWATRFAAKPRAAIALAYLGFPASVMPPAARDGFGVLTAMGEAVRVLGIVFESVVWSGRAPQGTMLLRCIYGGGRDPAASRLSDDALLAQARADVATMLGVTAAPTHQSVVRQAAGIARYDHAHAAFVQGAELLASQAKVVLAGADYHGVSVNQLCADAARVVAEVATQASA